HRAQMAGNAPLPDRPHLHQSGAGLRRPACARHGPFLLSPDDQPSRKQVMLRLRSWMFVPGNSEKMITKAFGLDLDVAMLDLEDGVVPALKSAARPVVAAALSSPRAGAGPVRYVRVNGVDTGELDADLDAVVVDGLEGLV